MKSRLNKTGEVINYFRQELKGFYPKHEVENFIFLTFEQYLGFSKTDLVLNKNEKINESQSGRLFAVVKELKQNKPIQYILGETDFFGLKLRVTPDVLIPRPETEELVQWIINDIKSSIMPDNLEKLAILDIGTGSGCIAIALKKNLSTVAKTEISATDISKTALSIARKNAKINDVKISFLYEDILQKPHPPFVERNRNEPGEGPFDIIVSNPPYINISDKKQMDKNVLDYEPHLALFVDDENPFLFYDIISDIALSKLKKNGKLYFEINEKYGNVIELLIEKKGFSNIQIKKDIRGKERMICGTLRTY